MTLKGGSKTCCGTGMWFPLSSVIPGREANPESRGSGFALSRAPERRCWLKSQSLNLVRAPRQRDVLGFHVEVERVIAAVAADAGGLHAAERRRQMADVFRVEPDHAGFQRICDAQGPAHVVGPDVAGEPVFHVVGDRDRILLIS